MTTTIDALVEALTLIRGKHGCGALVLPVADLDRVDAALAQARAEQSNQLSGNSGTLNLIATTPPAAPVAKLEPLPTAELEAIVDELGGAMNFCKTWGYETFARRVEAAHNAKLGNK